VLLINVSTHAHGSDAASGGVFVVVHPMVSSPREAKLEFRPPGPLRRFEV